MYIYGKEEFSSFLTFLMEKNIFGDRPDGVALNH